MNIRKYYTEIRISGLIILLLGSSEALALASESILPCNQGDVEERTVPDKRRWRKAERIEGPVIPSVYLGWIRMALGLDWRAMKTKAT